MRRQLLLGICAVVVSSASASAQLLYDYTTFVHGFNDGPSRFQTPNTAGLLRGQVNVKTAEFPYLDGSLTIDQQATNLYNALVGDPGAPHILVGHSMGGLTSRSMYFSHPSLVAGIITLGTPHQGAPIADNATRVTGYLADEVTDFFQNVTLILLRPTPGNILSAGAIAIIQYLAHNYISDKVQRFLDAEFGTKSPGLNDIKTTSPTVARLGNTIDGLPHATVLGTIGRRNAVWRLAFSNFYADAQFDGAMHQKNKVKSVVKACRQIGWNFIIHTGVGRMCNQIDNALGSIDDRWAAWTMGAAEKRDASATFDGLVPTSHSRYPGTSLSDPNVNFYAATVNHLNIQYNPIGINRIAAAMTRIGAGPPPPPPPPPGTIQSVSVSGNDQVEAGCPGGWMATPYGGTGPYTYLWNIDGNQIDTGNENQVSWTASGSSMSIQVTVTDSQGSTGTGYKTVTVVSGNCT
jgi:pimeloyl-ACP methyl ester carboxylesterase